MSNKYGRLRSKNVLQLFAVLSFRQKGMQAAKEKKVSCKKFPSKLLKTVGRGVKRFFEVYCALRFSRMKLPYCGVKKKRKEE